MANRNTSQAQTQAAPVVANPPVTFTLEQLNKIVAQAVAEATAQKGKTDNSTDMEALTVKAFAKKGFKDIQPRVNVLTYNKWVDAGYLVKKGEHSIKVKNLRLFHISQCEKINSKEQAKLFKEREAKIAAKAAKGEPAQAQA